MAELVSFEYVLANIMIELSEDEKPTKISESQIKKYETMISKKKYRNNKIVISNKSDITKITLNNKKIFIKNDDTYETSVEHIEQLKTRYRFLVDPALVEIISDKNTIERCF